MSASDQKKEHDRRKLFLDDMKLLQRDEYHEIFRIIKTNNVEYSENNNGVFFNVNLLSQEVFEKLNSFLQLCKLQRENDQKRTIEMETILVNQLKDEAL